MTQAGVSRARAVKALKASSGDIVSGETPDSPHTPAPGHVLVACQGHSPWACLLDQLCALGCAWPGVSLPGLHVHGQLGLHCSVRHCADTPII
jgi:hypothetical protein